MSREIGVLDHGYVRLLNLAGPVRRENRPFDADDIDPALVARISFDNFGSDRTREQELKLVNYLLTHKHNTPIEMIETWWEMKLPIFVARQLVRHRTVAINEQSARYSELSDDFYIPKYIRAPSTTNKQGSDDGDFMQFEYNLIRASIKKSCEDSYRTYQTLIKQNVAKEQARGVLPVNIYTKWVWKQDLYNLLHMLRLRLDEHAQWETQEYARAIFSLLRLYLPKVTEMAFPDNN